MYSFNPQAITVLMHANTLDWSDDIIPSLHVATQNFPQQAQRERKVTKL